MLFLKIFCSKTTYSGDVITLCNWNNRQILYPHSHVQAFWYYTKILHSVLKSSLAQVLGRTEHVPHVFTSFQHMPLTPKNRVSSLCFQVISGQVRGLRFERKKKLFFPKFFTNALYTCFNVFKHRKIRQNVFYRYFGSCSIPCFSPRIFKKVPRISAKKVLLEKLFL